MNKIKLGKYRHFKGHDCEVMGTGIHTETLEEYVIYKHADKIWLRPMSMFFEKVTRDGKTMPRFVYIGD